MRTSLFVHCDECGYHYNEPARNEVAPRIRAFRRRYTELLARRPDAELRRHRATGVWSALEYACHIRDVFRTQTSRVALSLREDTPVYETMRRDERAVEERYNQQVPAAVLRELSEAAAELATAFESLDDDGWQRTGVYSYPTRQIRTLEWVGRHTIHEGEHHLQDISRQLN